MELSEFVPEIICCHLESCKAEAKFLSRPESNQFLVGTHKYNKSFRPFRERYLVTPHQTNWIKLIIF